LLLITYDEATAAFIDHVPPPACKTSGTLRRSRESHRNGAPFAFDRLGVRGPHVAVFAMDSQERGVRGT